MHEANTALLDILVDNSVITGQNVQKLQILLFFTSYIARILKMKNFKNFKAPANTCTTCIERNCIVVDPTSFCLQNPDATILC